MEAQLTIDRLIKVATVQMSGVMADLGIVAPRSGLASKGGTRKAWRGIVAVHYFNAPDRCFYRRFPESPLRAAVEAGLIGEQTLNEAYRDYSKIIYRRIGALKAAVRHLRQLMDAEQFVPCALDPRAREKIEADLSPLDELINEVSGQESVTDEMTAANRTSDDSNDIAVQRIENVLRHNHARSLGVAPEIAPLPELIMSYLPDPYSPSSVAADFQGPTKQPARGHRWFSEPDIGSYDLKKHLSECLEPWQRLAALTEFFVIAPWLGIPAKNYRKVLSIFAEAPDDGWDDAVKQLPSLNGHLREILYEVHNPLAPVARMIVYHNGGDESKLEKNEHQLHDAVLVLGTQLASDLNNYAIRVAAEGFSAQSQMNNDPVVAWREVLNYIIPFIHAEVRGSDPAFRGEFEGRVRDPYSGSIKSESKTCTNDLEGLLHPFVTVDGEIRYHPAYEPEPSQIEIGVATREERDYFSNAIAAFAERTSMLWNLARGNFALSAPSEASAKFDPMWCHEMLTRYLTKEKTWSEPIDLLKAFVCHKVLDVCLSEEWNTLQELLALAHRDGNLKTKQAPIQMKTKLIQRYGENFRKKLEPFGIQLWVGVVDKAFGPKKRASWEALSEELEGIGLNIIVPKGRLKEITISWET